MKTLISMVAVALVGFSCGGDPCGRSSKCPNDVPSTPAERDQCRATLSAFQAAPCYNESLDVSVCALDNAVCGADGKTDATLTATKAQSACTNQRANLAACCTKNPSSTICG